MSQYPLYPSRVTDLMRKLQEESEKTEDVYIRDPSSDELVYRKVQESMDASARASIRRSCEMLRKELRKTEGDCSCERLLKAPLSGEDELPDHVCPNTRMWSCYNWLESYRPGLWEHCRTKEQDARVPVDAAHLCFRFRKGEHYPDWPPFFGNSNRCVSLIIQHWAEVGLDEETIKKMTNRDDWKIIVDTVKHHCGKLQGRYGAKKTETETRSAKVRVRSQLISTGFPATPGMIDYILRYSLNSPNDAKENSDPTAGTLITSFFVQPSFVERLGTASGFFDDVLFLTNGLSWGSFFNLTDEVLAKVATIIKSHRDWWKKRPPTSLSLGFENPRGRPPKYPDDYTDLQRRVNDPKAILEGMIEREIERRSEEFHRALKRGERELATKAVKQWWRTEVGKLPDLKKNSR